MRRTLGLITGAALGLTGSQFPEFAQQYEQRLGGAVDELQVVLNDFDATAAAQGLTRAEALARYDVNSDTFIVERGDDMRQTIGRYERLSSHLAALEAEGPFTRVTALMQNYDEQIAQSALDAYAPAVPTTPEGAGFAGIFAAAGYGLIALILAPFRRRRRQYN